ncbi:hypothetical protein SAMN04488548_12926 [Gordonia westfalica]|uniref:Uncharacterized protein n=1 Tax=Gordonia westfalica TaxID=158898 RepID=A0A1H2E777_9ACTN|nr:hypothetical protein SAMN04488548_1295 [Gordonia westfalica]SDT90905.1 hypothetical protein SAMN04488548_12925 [Gordonia westfalica]SDT90917.1 hypothetical protein SAMN04488548_12926 [Gordonia westfalica]
METSAPKKSRGLLDQSNERKDVLEWDIKFVDIRNRLDK